MARLFFIVEFQRENLSLSGPLHTHLPAACHTSSLCRTLTTLMPSDQGSSGGDFCNACAGWLLVVCAEV